MGDARVAGGAREFAREFWAGLTSRTLGGWFATVGFALAEVVVCCFVFQPRTLARLDPRYLMASPTDEYCALSLHLIRLRGSRPERLQVAYLGASQATRALASAEPEEISDELSRAAGTDVDFDVLSANAERYEDALAITDQLPPGWRGVFVLVVDDYKDDYRPWKTLGDLRNARERIALVDAPSVLEAWRDVGDYVPVRTGVFFLDHFSFFAARRGAALRFRKTPRVRLRRGGEIEDPERLERALVDAEATRAELDAEGPSRAKRAVGQAPILGQSRPVVTKLLRILDERGIPVVFVHDPESPVRRERFAEHVATFERQFSKFAEHHGALYWDFNDELDLRARDFQDAVHLGDPAARRRFQDALVARLGALIAERFPDEPPAQGRRRGE